MKLTTIALATATRAEKSAALAPSNVCALIGSVVAPRLSRMSLQRWAHNMNNPRGVKLVRSCPCRAATLWLIRPRSHDADVRECRQ